MTYIINSKVARPSIEHPHFLPLACKMPDGTKTHMWIVTSGVSGVDSGDVDIRRAWRLYQNAVKLHNCHDFDDEWRP